MINYLKSDKWYWLLPLLSMLLLNSCAGGKLHQARNVAWHNTQLPTAQISKQMYSCQINGGYLWKKYSISGVLLIKKMEDSSTRVVFQNELGMTFFDFSWTDTWMFKVEQIIAKMNNEALIKTLKKDFEALFRIPSAAQSAEPTGTWARTSLEKGWIVYRKKANAYSDFYIVNPKLKKIVSFTPVVDFGPTELPQELKISHHKANFEILLKSITPIKE